MREARDAVAFHYAVARGTTIAAAVDGRSEVALAEALGVDRMTIRKWVGKAKHSSASAIPR
jgi:transposase-like protein